MAGKEIVERISSAHQNLEDALDLLFWVWSDFFQQATTTDNLLEIGEIVRDWLKKADETPGLLSEEDYGIFSENAEKFRKQFLFYEDNLLKYTETVIPACDNEPWQRIVRLAEYIMPYSDQPQKWQMIIEG